MAASSSHAPVRPSSRSRPATRPATTYRQAISHPASLRRAEGSSFCEWKGNAVYWDVVTRDAVLSRVAWSYPNTSTNFAMLRDHVAFYAGPFDKCTVNDERVVPQPGRFYGGWITSRYAGPFKDIPGSMG